MLVWTGPSGKVRRLSGTRMSPSGFTGTNGVSGSGLASSGACDYCHSERRWDSTEGGEWRQSACSPGSHILTGDTTITDFSGGPAGGCEGTSGGGTGSSSAMPAVRGAERGHSVMEWARVCFSCGRPGHGGEPVFTSGHFFSVLVAGLVGECPGLPISGDTDRWNWNVVYSGKRGMVRAGGSASRIIGGGGGGKVRLTLAGEMWWIEERPAGMAVAGGAWAWTHLCFEHARFSATGEPSHRSSWTA